MCVWLYSSQNFKIASGGKVSHGLIADQDNMENLNMVMKCFLEIEECHKCNCIEGQGCKKCLCSKNSPPHPNASFPVLNFPKTNTTNYYVLPNKLFY